MSFSGSGSKSAFNGRFLTIYRAPHNNSPFHFESILCDTQTGVQYLCLSGPSGALSATPLLDTDGKPLIYQPPSENTNG
ncbi:MAG: DUF6440 family protein [Oscillospiraceae bacterium]|jgi:hypothetical protein|nr:DUF6440 family protein [Oscillospiraceae bacterium]